MTEASAKTSNGRTWLEVLRFVLPVTLAIAGGYGAVQYSSATTQSKLLELERRTETNRQEIEKIVERAVTSREMQQYMQTTESNFTDIKTELREIRRERR